MLERQLRVRRNVTFGSSISIAQTIQSTFTRRCILGNKKVCANGIVLTDCKAYKGSFEYDFRLGNDYLNITQYEKEYELKINGYSFSKLIEAETEKKSIKYDKNTANIDPYKVKNYAENLTKAQTLASNSFVPPQSRKKRRQVEEYFEADEGGYEINKRSTYDPYVQDESILNKYRNPAKVSSPKEESQPKSTKKTKNKEKKQNLNDSWDKAWEDNFSDINKYSTYNQPAPKKSQPLNDEENFNFDEMKTNLNQSKKPQPSKNLNEDEFESYYNHIDEPQEKQSDEKRESLNLNKIVNTKITSKLEINEGFDFFGQAQGDLGENSNEGIIGGLKNKINQAKGNILDDDNNQIFEAPKPQQKFSSPPVQQSNNELDDIFGGAPEPSPVQTKINMGQNDMGFNQPPQMNTFGGSNVKANPKSMFGSDASDIFNTTPVPMMNQNYNNGTQGYGMYNQGYGMPNQGFSQPNAIDFNTSNINTDYSGGFNTQFNPHFNQFNTGNIQGFAPNYNQDFNTGYYNQGYGGYNYTQQNYQQPGYGGSSYQTSNYQQPTQDFDLFGGAKKQPANSNSYNKKLFIFTMFMYSTQANMGSNLDDLFG